MYADFLRLGSPGAGAALGVRDALCDGGATARDSQPDGAVAEADASGLLQGNGCLQLGQLLLLSIEKHDLHTLNVQFPSVISRRV